MSPRSLSDPASGVMTEHPPSRCVLRRTGMGPTLTPYEDRDYIVADGQMVAIAVTQNSNTTSLYYPVLDHLGSVSVIVDGNLTLANGNANPNYGLAIDRYSFDAWGEARDPGQWTPRTCSDNPQSPFVRGFTGQEHLPSGVCLINFNARIYNPAIGRFFSADPTVEAPYNPQDLNRYSYVLNFPTAFTDPSGLCFLGCFWHSPIFDAALDIAIFFVAPELEGYSLFGDSGLIAQAAAFNVQAIGVLALNGGLAGGISSAAGGGNVVKGFWMGAAQAGATFGLGGPLGSVLGPALGSATAGAFISQGMVGGLLSVASNTNFVSGFLAGGVGALAGPLRGGEFSFQGAVESAVLGGAASVLGGGKFANGAITATFAYAAGAAERNAQNTTVNMCEGSVPPDPPLTQDQIAAIVFNETQSLSGSDLSLVRLEIADTIINADEAWGDERTDQ
ncbi:MAG: RHS repeat domain-containing protein, partial [Rhizomicrobium sp.]